MTIGSVETREILNQLYLLRREINDVIYDLPIGTDVYCSFDDGLGRLNSLIYVLESYLDRSRNSRH